MLNSQDVCSKGGDAGLLEACIYSNGRFFWEEVER